MTEELKELYERFLNQVKTGEPDEVCEQGLRAIIDYENALFGMHFGKGPVFRKLVVCGLCLGILDLILESADLADKTIIEDVRCLMRDCYRLTTEKGGAEE